MILSNLESQKKIEFKDENRDGFLVYKFSPDKIAHEIYDWVNFVMLFCGENAK